MTQLSTGDGMDYSASISSIMGTPGGIQSPICRQHTLLHHLAKFNIFPLCAGPKLMAKLGCGSHVPEHSDKQQKSLCTVHDLSLFTSMQPCKDQIKSSHKYLLYIFQIRPLQEIFERRIQYSNHLLWTPIKSELCICIFQGCPTGGPHTADHIPRGHHPPQHTLPSFPVTHITWASHRAIWSTCFPPLRK